MASPDDLVVNGWRLLSVPAFDQAYERLIEEVEALKVKDPHGYGASAKAKRLAAVRKLIYEDIPSDPASPAYRQGDSLGPQGKHWFRAEFSQQYRLFFRWNREHRIIIYGWINDEATKRAYGSRSGAYQVFRARLDQGRPPSDWDELMAQARALAL